MRLINNEKEFFLVVRVILCGLCFWGLCNGKVMAKEVVANQKAPIQSEILLRSDRSWDGASYNAYPPGQPELTVLKITIPPNTTLPWHTHSMPNAGYMLSGEIMVENKIGERKLVTTGQVLPETVDTIHRGVTGNQAAVLIVFYAGQKGMALARYAKTEE